MRRRKVDSGVERQLLIALITSKHFLSQSFSVLDIDLIDVPHMRQVASWCLDYYKQYKEAPKAHIESIYHSWAEDRDNDDTADSIHDFLESLSDEYDSSEINVPYLLDQLGDYLGKKKLQRLQDNLEHSLSQGDRETAEQSVLKYRSVQVGQGAGINPLTDRDVWKRAFSEPAQPLINFGNNDAGWFLNRALTRDALIALQGPEKRGKTFWVLEFVIRALRERRKVALFEVGDLSESQLMLRLGGRLSGRPTRKDQCGTIRIPSKIRKLRKEEIAQQKQKKGEDAPRAKLSYKTKECPRPVSRTACWRACRKFMRSCGIPKDKPYLMTSIHANSSINVRGIEGILDQWESEHGFIPDVIGIDYADILAAEDNREQGRDKINTTWKALRRLSQERHALVIVPTQADAESYSRETQNMHNFSEDKRKYAHVTGTLGLNQTQQEKDQGIMRLNWLVLRESHFSTNQCLWVGQCLALARAYCCATL